jgi:hypothetical protein
MNFRFTHVIAGVTTAVIPAVLVESLGLRRFGSISGLIVRTLGIAGGPLVMGLIFDLTPGYTRSFEFGAACLVCRRDRSDGRIASARSRSDPWWRGGVIALN